VEIVLTLALGGHPISRTLLADTGAGSRGAGIDLLLDENDCLLAGGKPSQIVMLGGSYRGAFPTYVLRVQIPALGFNRKVRAVAIASPPAGFDGIAAFGFINRFTYGNFGDANQFGLEM